MSKRDRYILSVILGGAVGSVLGLLIAPEKGDKTREKAGEQARELLTQGQELSSQFTKKHHKEIEQAVRIIKEGAHGIWNGLKDLMRPRW